MCPAPRAHGRWLACLRLRLLAVKGVTRLFLSLLPLAAACGDQPTAPRPTASETFSLSVHERADIWLTPASYDSVPRFTSSAVAFLGMDYNSNVFGSQEVFHFVATAPGRAVVLFVSATGALPVRDTINVHRDTTGLRVLETLSLTVGQRADLTPADRFDYDSLPTVSSSAVALLGTDRFPEYTPEGYGGTVQVYHFVATATGQTVVTLRYIDGTAAVQDTINVQTAAPHGRFSQVSAGLLGNTCAVATSGAGYCWGGFPADSADSAGDRADVFTNTPSALPGGLPFTAISAGWQHDCGLTPGGAAYCWGSNLNGMLGNGNTSASPAPVAVVGGLTFKAVSAGIYHTCGLTTAGAAYCWGDNYDGALGNGTSNVYINSGPVPVSGGLIFQAVGAGWEHSCGLTTVGAAYCWGINVDGELGTGDTRSSAVAVPVTGGLTFAALSVGGYHECALAQVGAAYCWGDNTYGELGNGTTFASLAPSAVSGGLTFVSISAGDGATCGLTTGGAAYCWGRGASSTPQPVSGGLTFAAISAGSGHVCGVTLQGEAYCWGDNGDGELGDGSTTAHSTPTPVYGP